MLKETLEANPVFGCLPSGELESVLQAANPHSYPKGQWIAHLSTNWPYLFLVEDGRVQAVKESPEGRSLIVAEILPGELFWGISFFLSDAAMPVALIAKEDTRLILWSREDLKPILIKNGCGSWELICLMINKMQYASDMLNKFAFQPTAERLAKVLLDYYGDSEGQYVARDMTLDEMAARIGSTREMVCRHLYHFADQGVIEINRTEFRVVDQRSLEDLADQGR